MLIFHIGLKEPPRGCTYVLAKEGSKRSASNWTHWFKEIQFYQVYIRLAGSHKRSVKGVVLSLHEQLCLVQW